MGLNSRDRQILERLVRGQHALERRISRSERSHDAAVGLGAPVVDAQGAVVGRVGGPEPIVSEAEPVAPLPTPAAPSVNVEAGVVVVHVDGLDAEGDPAPAGVVMARVYASLEAGFTPSAGSYQGMVVGPGGRGSVPLGLAPGVWHVRVVWAGASGQESAPSDPVVADLEPLVDAEDIEQALAVAQERLDAVKAALGALSGPLTPMLAGVLPDVEGRVYYQKDETGEIVSAWQVANGAWVQQPLESVVLVRVTTDQLVAGMGLIGGVLIEDGAVTAEHITASESLTAKVAEFLKVKAGMIEANAFSGQTFTGGTFSGAIFTGGTVQSDATANRGTKMDIYGFRAFNSAGIQTVRLNGTDNLLTGRVQTNRPGEAGIILVPKTSTGSPGIWFSESGSALSGDAAIFMDADGNMNLRGKSGPNGAAHIKVHGGLDVTSGGILVGEYGVFSDGSIEAKSMGGFGSRGSWGFASNGILTSRGANFNDTTNILGPLVYQGRTESTFSANLGIAANPADRIYKLTSKRANKVNIEDLQVDEDRVLSIRPRTWFDRAQVENELDGSEQVGDSPDGPTVDESLLQDGEARLARVPGVVAEEVEALGLTEFVTYEVDEHGTRELSGVAYDRLAVALFPITRRLRDRVSELEAENATLSDRLDRLEAQLGIPTV